MKSVNMDWSLERLKIPKKSAESILKRWLIKLLGILIWSSCSAVYAEGAYEIGKTGIWSGTIGDYPVIVCIEDDKAAYYYPGQRTEISIRLKDGELVETLNGQITGIWKIEQKVDGFPFDDLIAGEWRKPKGKKTQPIELWHFLDSPAACSSSEYRQALLLPDEPLLSLNLPKPGHVAARGQAAAVIMPNGELWIWDNHHPRPRLMGQDYVRVAVGNHHFVAIKSDGSLWGWGGNLSGQLGDSIATYEPVKIGIGFVDAAANDEFTLAVRKDGTLWSWGGRARDKTGKRGGALTNTKPRLIGKSFVSVSAGSFSFAAIKANGSLWMWGRDDDGQLGVGERGSSYHRHYGESHLPMLVGEDFTAVSTGYSHTAAVSKDGTLWTWGSGAWGTLGAGAEIAKSNVPIKIGSGFVWAAAGYLNSAAVNSDGSLWLWGANERGMFGDCSKAIHKEPVLIGTGFLHAALGDSFLVAQKSDGSVWTWGWPWNNGPASSHCGNPVRVSFVDHVGAGSLHTR